MGNQRQQTLSGGPRTPTMSNIGGGAVRQGGISGGSGNQLQTLLGRLGSGSVLVGPNQPIPDASWFLPGTFTSSPAYEGWLDYINSPKNNVPFYGDLNFNAPYQFVDPSAAANVIKSRDKGFAKLNKVLAKSPNY